MRAAAEEIDHGRGQPGRPASQLSQMAVEFDAALCRLGATECQRNSQDGIAAQPRFVGAAIQLEQALIQIRLVREVLSSQGLMDMDIDILDGTQAAQPGMTLGIAIAQFERFGAARRGPRWHRGRPAVPGAQQTARINRGPAAAVEDLLGAQRLDAAHARSSPDL